MGELLQFVADRSDELWLRVGEHLFLTGVSTLAAILIGVPLGIAATCSNGLRTFVLGIVSMFQTIPSLALLAILLAALGKIGFVPAVIALTVYALLPIVRNTVTGLDGVDASVIEAARGVGMNRIQQLRLVQLPLALPVIVAGIRTAAVVGVGIATLSAFIGAGGLGQFINRGLALSNSRLILLGAIPAGVLAIVVDLLIEGARWGLTPVRQSDEGSFRAKLRPVAVMLPLLLFVGGSMVVVSKESQTATSGVVRIGSKNFTEQLILAEMMAQAIEQNTDLTVERQFNLGGTMICHEAMVAGELDVYAEYTGTGLVSVLNAPVPTGETVLDVVRREYGSRFGIEWLQPFGFNNTYAISVRRDDATKNGWTSISDVSKASESLRAGFTAEFSERSDGYPGLKEAYNLRFREIRDLEPALMYSAAANDEVDVICAFATDGRILKHDLVLLSDDRRFFPPYHAVPTIRHEFGQRYPKVRETLEMLAGSMTDRQMQELNRRVDIDQEPVAIVAADFLRSVQGNSKSVD